MDKTVNIFVGHHDGGKVPHRRDEGMAQSIRFGIMPQKGEIAMAQKMWKLKNFIHGEFSDSSDHFEITNPANGDLLGTAPLSGQAEADRAVEAAGQAKAEWALKPAVERAAFLHEIADGIRKRKDEIADVIIREQGKIPSLAQVEAGFTADYMDYMAEWARRIEGEVITSDRPGEHILLLRKPVGVVAGILPWNFPFFLIARKMAPALVTGNTVVVKPSKETPINCSIFAEIVSQTGLPDGVFNVVYGNGSFGSLLSHHPKINMVSFTGSVETGEKIMAAAAPNITKVNLELGGKAPAIVLADADIDLAVKAIKDSRIINSGQVCNCAERVYVEKEAAGEFLEKMTKAMAAVTVGDPSAHPEIDMGPVINEGALHKIKAKVDRALQEGAELTQGGGIEDLGNHGFYFQPTVLAGCREDMDIMRKEVFGPVLPVQIVSGLDEAIALSNDSEYGLTSSIYTKSLSKAMYAIDRIDFGETYINRENFEAMQGFHAGTRKSGIGGADGKHGLYEYTHTHVVYIE